MFQIQIVSLDDRNFINRYKDFWVTSDKKECDKIADYILDEITGLNNAKIEIKKLR